MSFRLLGWLLVLFLLPHLACRHEDQTRVALVAKAMDSEFWLSVRDGAQSAVADVPDVRLSVLAPQREILIDEQVNILEDQLVRGVDALVVAPSGVAQVLPVLERAHLQGVPVIVFDTDIQWDHKRTYVGTDNVTGGRMAGEFIADRLEGVGRVAVIRGIPGVASQDDRLSGFLEALRYAPGLELVANQPANSERALAMNVMENILSANPDLDAVFATNDEMALGVVEALDARGLADRVLVVGFDAGSEALRALETGRLEALVAQYPYRMGKLAVEAALRILEGEKLEPFVDSGSRLVTSENLKDFRAEMRN